MKDDEIEFGKYYKLDSGGRYFSIDLQRHVFFEGTVVVKVKVKYEDVGRVVHDGGKVRCRRITILD